jgi:hypothetical protein
MNHINLLYPALTPIVFSIGLFLFNQIIYKRQPTGAPNSIPHVFKYPRFWSIFYWLVLIIFATIPVWFRLGFFSGNHTPAGSSHALDLTGAQQELLGWSAYFAFSAVFLYIAVMLELYQITVTGDSISIRGSRYVVIKFSSIKHVYFRPTAKGGRALVIEYNLHQTYVVPGSLEHIDELASYLNNHLKCA